jgi:hypothetical protein
LQAIRASVSPVGSHPFIDPGLLTGPLRVEHAVSSAAPTQTHAISRASFMVIVFMVDVRWMRCEWLSR